MTDPFEGQIMEASYRATCPDCDVIVRGPEPRMVEMDIRQHHIVTHGSSSEHMSEFLKRCHGEKP